MNLETEKMLKDMREPNEIQDVGYIHKRLDAREKHPVLFNRFKDTHEAQEREQRDKADALKLWEREGGNPRDFERQWVEITTEARTSKIRRAQQGAHDAEWRRTKERF